MLFRSFGIAVAYAKLGDPYRAAQAFDGIGTTSAEINWELAYSTNITPWLSLQPGVHFIQHPGADPTIGDSWVAGLRFEIAQDHSWQFSARRENKTDESYARTKP